MTDPANDSSRSGPKFWKHSAPGSVGQGARVSIFFSAENASHSLSKTYGCRSLLLFCSIDPPVVRPRLSRLAFFRLLVSLLGVFCVREIRKRRTCERPENKTKNGTVNCQWPLNGIKGAECGPLIFPSSRLFRIFICSATCGTRGSIERRRVFVGL